MLTDRELDICAKLIKRIETEHTILFLCQDLPENETIERYLLSQPWSVVYTTLRRSDLANKFKEVNEDREVKDVVLLEDAVHIRKSKGNLSIVRLLGVDEGEESYDQDVTAQVFLETIHKLLKDLGGLIIDGLPDDGNLIRSLYLQLARLNRPKTISILGGKEMIPPSFESLIAKGTAVAYEHSLPYILDELSVSWPDLVKQKYSVGSKGVKVYFRKRVVTLDSSLDESHIKGVSKFAQLLTIEEVDNSCVFEKEKANEYFKIFLKDSVAGFPLWYAYRNGNNFHMERYFEYMLFKKTEKILEDAVSQERKRKPIMLRGQTCSGKTNALGALAYKIFQDQKNPVVYIPEPRIDFTVKSETDALGQTRRVKSEAFERLEALLRHLEERAVQGVQNQQGHSEKVQQAPAALIVWDTACKTREDVKKAYELLSALRSYGRVVQIVCTSYSMPTHVEINGKKDPFANYECIDVNVYLQGFDSQGNPYDDLPAMTKLLERYSGYRSTQVKRQMERYANSESFFGALYVFRDLRDKIGNLTSAEIKKQAENLDDQLGSLVLEREQQSTDTILGRLLREACNRFGWHLETTYDDDDGELDGQSEPTEEEAKSRKSLIDSLIHCIAFCTLYGEYMPVSMAIRFLGELKVESYKLFEAIETNPMFISFVSEYDEPLVAIRSQLEAQLVLNESENCIIELATMMMGHLEPEWGEIEVMTNLIRYIGPNSKHYLQSKNKKWDPENKTTNGNKEKFEKLIESIAKFRMEKYCVELLPSELTLKREFIIWMDTDAEKKKLLKSTKELAERCIETFDGGRVNDSFEATVYVEWANTANRLCDYTGELPRDINYDKVSNHMLLVLKRFPHNGHAHSARIWAGIRYAKIIKDVDEKLEFLMKLDDLRNNLENEISDDEQDTNMIGALDDLIDATKMTEERFNRSIQNKKPYGLMYKVRQIIRRGNEKDFLDFTKPITHKALHEKCEEINNLLDNPDYEDIVWKSAGLMHSLINIKWMMHTGHPIIPEKEDQLTHLKEKEWEIMYNRCCRFLDVLCEFKPPRIMFLRAVCAAHLSNSINECEDLFEELSNYKSERKRYYILCDYEGKPRTFSGRVTGKRGNDYTSGNMRLEGNYIVYPIYYHYSRLGGGVPANGQQYTGLSVAMSYYGFQACKV